MAHQIGDAITINAVVEHITSTGHLVARVSDGYLFVSPVDAMQAPPRFVRYTTAERHIRWRVLAQEGDRLWIQAGDGEPITVATSWVDDVAEDTL